jgi:hypothetical protein
MEEKVDAQSIDIAIKIKYEAELLQELDSAGRAYFIKEVHSMVESMSSTLLRRTNILFVKLKYKMDK